MRHVLPWLFALALFGGSMLQWERGLADNGDFTRLSLWISSAPVGFDASWPTEGSARYDERFYRHVLPYWTLDFPLRSRWVSSILPLWAPGIALNMLVSDPHVLFLPWVSVTPRLLAALFLLLALRWIGRHAGRRGVLAQCAAGVPMLLALLSMDYNAYYTSLYQEPASLVGLLLLIAATVRAHERGDTRLMPWLLGFAALFLAAAKLSNLYWAPLVLLFAVPWPRLGRSFRRIALYAAVAGGLPLLLSAGQSLLYHSAKANAYQSLFCGALAFSRDPGPHLQRIGIPDGAPYIGRHAYCAEGRECMDRYGGRISHRAVLDVIAHEPRIAADMLAFAADSMQRTAFTHLGSSLLVNAPRALRPYVVIQPPDPHAWLLPALWPVAKRLLFPRGPALLWTLGIAALCFGAAWWRARGSAALVARLGLMLVLACAADLWMQVFGDGMRDLLKHLYLANILFDGVVLCAVVLSLLLWTGRDASATAGHR